MAKKNPNIAGGSTPAVPVSHRLYLFFYGVGLQTARLGRRIRRCLRRPAAAIGHGLQLAWLAAIGRPLQCQHQKLQRIYAAFPAAGRELAAALHKNPFSVFPCFGRLCRRAVKHYKEELLVLWRLAGPVAATIVLIVTVAAWQNTSFCLALNYRGQELGYIENAETYSEAATMAVNRVVNVDNSFSVESVPSLSVTVQGRRSTLSDTELCDAILRTAGDSIAEASGLYVDGSFIGATESADELNSVLESIKDAYYDKNDSSQRAEFVQQVETVEGLYPSQSVVAADELKSQLTAEAVVKKTYTVQAGDTLSTIASKNSMSTADLRAMNTAYASTDMVHIGDELTVQLPQPFLQVQVIKTISYSESIDYTTQYVSNADKPTTYSVVKQKGEEGLQNVVAEITYLNGLETSRKIISTIVVKQPVSKIVERGTQKVVTSSGFEVVVGDGKTIGSMIWPVPICHNMSRGFSSYHSGLDICNGPVTVRNRPAVAADGGTVIYAGWYYGYGNYVKIQHANGLCTAYGHLGAISVVKGQTVSQNQQIGLIGSTGQSSGPHLHFEVIRNGVKVNPLNYVRP